MGLIYGAEARNLVLRSFACQFEEKYDLERLGLPTAIRIKRDLIHSLSTRPTARVETGRTPAYAEKLGAPCETEDVASIDTCINCIGELKSLNSDSCKEIGVSNKHTVVLQKVA